MLERNNPLEEGINLESILTEGESAVDEYSATNLLESTLSFLEQARDRLITTGIHELDDATNGMRGYMVLGGRAGSGKTSFAASISVAALKAGHPLLYVTSEVADFLILHRIIKNALKAEGLENVNLRKVAPSIKESLKQVYIFDLVKLGETPVKEKITGICDAISQKFDRKPYLIVDSLHGVAHAIAGAESERSALINASLFLAQIAQNNAVGVLALSHLNRESLKEGSAEQTALLGSSAIEHYADYVIVIRRFYDGRETDLHLQYGYDPPIDFRNSSVYALEFTMNKNRYGRCVKFDVIFDAQKGLFYPDTRPAPKPPLERAYRERDFENMQSKIAEKAMEELSSGAKRGRSKSRS